MEKIWGGSGRDGSTGITLDSKGNLYLVGSSDSFSTADTPFNKPAPNSLLITYDPTGNLSWARIFEADQSTTGSGIAVDPSGSVYLLGNYYGNLATNSSSLRCLFVNCSSTYGPGVIILSFLLKFDSRGHILWQRIWGMNYTNPYGQDFIESLGFRLALDVTGNVYVTGGHIRPGLDLMPISSSSIPLETFSGSESGEGRETKRDGTLQ